MLRRSKRCQKRHYIDNRVNQLTAVYDDMERLSFDWLLDCTADPHTDGDDSNLKIAWPSTLGGTNCTSID